MAKDIKSVLVGYFGGKSRIADRIIPLFPSHTCYCEPFCGAAWVLFKKGVSQNEVINDINGEIVNLFRVVRDMPDALDRCFEYAIISRQEFERLKDIDVSSLDSVQRAWRLLYIIGCSHSGKLKNASFRACIQSTGHNVGKYLEYRRGLIDMAHTRLKYVNIECLPYQDCIARYDSQQTFFYLDPPYCGKERYYGDKFVRDDFLSLVRILKGIKGKFLLSINDCPYSRDVFADFNIRNIDTQYTCAMRNMFTSEILVSNYDLCNQSEYAQGLLV